MKQRRIVRRTSHFTMLGALLQPVGGAALALTAYAVGAPAWVPVVFAAFAVGSAVYVARERAAYGAPRPAGLFVLMASGAVLTVFAGGLLESPLLFALGTIPVGTTALGPSLAFGRRVQLAMLATLALAVVGDLAGSPLAEAGAFVDREHAGPGFYLGTTLASLVILSGVALGGLAARQLRFAIEEAEAAASQARAEHLASLEARTRDVMLLAGTLADELCAPIADLRARAVAIRARATRPALIQRLEVLVAELDRVERRIVHHHTFARPTAASASVRVADLFAELAKGAEGLATTRQVAIAVDVPADLALEGDREKLAEILENLFQNALEASPERATVVLRAAPGPDAVHLEVLDEGPGLGPAAASLFVPGFTTKAQGSGLGLVLSRRLAEQLGGTLRLEPRDPTGCRALLCLPRR